VKPRILGLIARQRNHAGTAGADGFDLGSMVLDTAIP